MSRPSPNPARPRDRSATAAAPVDAEQATRVVLALRRILHATERHSSALRGSIGLTASQLVVLQELAARGEATGAALARGLSVSAPTMTGILRRLAARGLVDRRRSVSDRRRAPVSLTPAARELLRDAPTPLPAPFQARLASASENARRRTVRDLERIATLMEEDAS